MLWFCGMMGRLYEGNRVGMLLLVCVVCGFETVGVVL